MSKSRKYRRAVLLITAGIMTAALFCLTLAVAVLIQFGVENVALNNVTDHGYFAPQSAALDRRVKDLTRQCGLPEKIVSNIFDSEEVLPITKEYTLNRLKGFESDLNTEPVKERLKANLYQYLDEAGISKSALDMDALNQYLSQAAGLYKQTVDNSFILYYRQIRQSVIKPAIAAAFAAAIAAAACIFYMHKVTGMRRKTLSYTIRALLASGILCGAVALWYFVLGGTPKIIYSPEYMAAICQNFETSFFKQFLFGMMLWFLAAGGCAAAIFKIRQGRRAI